MSSGPRRPCLPHSSSSCGLSCGDNSVRTCPASALPLLSAVPSAPLVSPSPSLVVDLRELSNFSIKREIRTRCRTISHPTTTTARNPTTAPALIPPICPRVRPLPPVANTVVVTLEPVSVPETTTEKVEVRDGLIWLNVYAEVIVVRTLPVWSPELDKVVVVSDVYSVHSPGPHIPPPGQQPPNPAMSYIARIDLTARITYLRDLKNKQTSLDHNTLS